MAKQGTPKRTTTPPPARARSSLPRPSALLDTRVIYCGDNLEQLAKLPNACRDLVYIDPPFNSICNDEVFWSETPTEPAMTRMLPPSDNLLLSLDTDGGGRLPQQHPRSPRRSLRPAATRKTGKGETGKGDKTGKGDIHLCCPLTVNSYDAATAAFDVTEPYEPFAVNATTGSPTYGFASDTPASDGNGNLTYDGSQCYTYDAWNRLRTVSHGYRDAGGTLRHGQAFDTMGYDGLGRRVTKAVLGTGAWDCTYHYYLDGGSVVEERNGSNQTAKQFVWGKRYVDDLVQVAVNSNPTPTNNACDAPYWACTDANWNVLGIVNASGTVAERYEYTPYGQRQVFFSPGTNDTQCYAPTVAGRRVITTGSVTQAYGICEVGHQGLLHDEECSLVYDRLRSISFGTSRFLQRDTWHRRIDRENQGDGYQDGMNLYQCGRDNPETGLDPSGESYVGCTLYKCIRNAHGTPGRHAYLWLDCPGSPYAGGCGMWQSAGSGAGGGGRTPGSPWDQNGDDGPGTAGNTCVPAAAEFVPVGVGSSTIESVMKCCQQNWNRGISFPFLNDCHNHSDDCLGKFGIRPPPGTGRFW